MIQDRTGSNNITQQVSFSFFTGSNKISTKNNDDWSLPDAVGLISLSLPPPTPVQVIIGGIEYHIESICYTTWQSLRVFFFFVFFSCSGNWFPQSFGSAIEQGGRLREIMSFRVAGENLHVCKFLLFFNTKSRRSRLPTSHPMQIKKKALISHALSPFSDIVDISQFQRLVNMVKIEKTKREK